MSSPTQDAPTDLSDNAPSWWPKSLLGKYAVIAGGAMLVGLVLSIFFVIMSACMELWTMFVVPTLPSYFGYIGAICCALGAVMMVLGFLAMRKTKMPIHTRAYYWLPFSAAGVPPEELPPKDNDTDAINLAIGSAIALFYFGGIYLVVAWSPSTNPGERTLIDLFVSIYSMVFLFIPVLALMPFSPLRRFTRHLITLAFGPKQLT